MNGFAIRTGCPPELDVAWLLDRFEAHRHRLSSQLRDLSGREWLALSRCPEWTVHDVVRHVCDTTAIMADDANGPSEPFEGFDARTTPRRWLEQSEGEPVEDTMRRLDVLTESSLRSSRRLLDAGASFDVPGPYGPVHWTTLVLHGFWDSWLHERDMLLPLGRPCVSDPADAALAAAYGLFLAGKAASWSGAHVEDPSGARWRGRRHLSGARRRVRDCQGHAWRDQRSFDGCGRRLPGRSGRRAARRPAAAFELPRGARRAEPVLP